MYGQNILGPAFLVIFYAEYLADLVGKSGMSTN